MGYRVKSLGGIDKDGVDGFAAEEKFVKICYELE